MIQLRPMCWPALSGLLMLIYGPTLLAGPKVQLGKRWPADQRVSMDQIDHAIWERLLRTYVDEDGLVDYRGWHASPADRTALTQYLEELSRATLQPVASRQLQLAFWINAYNAVTIEGILQKYPVESIRDLTPKAWGFHIWHDLLLTVDDQLFSLDTMEHKILRPIGEPRIHFAIVCASIGCPRLLNRAYVPENIEAQLTANARYFFADSEKFRYDAARRRFQVSPILDWFQADFGTNKTELLQTISPLLPDAEAQKLAVGGHVSVEYLTYDWSLNDQSKRR